jgi:tetraacyldisaccharide 4'-kinase
MLLLSRLRNYLYDTKVLKSFRPAAFTISVGNLTWGGTGKTSLVKELASFFIQRGLRVAIISRGYGRKSKGALLVRNTSDDWELYGDEAYLLSRALPDAMVLVAENRIDALQLLNQPPDVILLDDAFQHRSIARDLDLVLIDASEDIAEQRLIPLGKLRESMEALGRADTVLLSHSNRANAKTMQWIERNLKSAVYHANYLTLNASEFEGMKVGAFCAIGSPEHFFDQLRSTAADVVMARSFRDHHVYQERELEKLKRDALSKGAESLVTTEKDAIRIGPRLKDPFLKVLRIKLQIQEEAQFRDFMLQRLSLS